MNKPTKKHLICAYLALKGPSTKLDILKAIHPISRRQCTTRSTTKRFKPRSNNCYFTPATPGLYTGDREVKKSLLAMYIHHGQREGRKHPLLRPDTEGSPVRVRVPAQQILRPDRLGVTPRSKNPKLPGGIHPGSCHMC